LALFFGGFSLINLLGSLRTADFDATLWWIDLRFVPQAFAVLLLLVLTPCLLAFALRPPLSPWRRFLTAGCVAVAGAISLANTLGFYLLLAKGHFSTVIPLPLSLFVTLALGFIGWAALTPAWFQPRFPLWAPVLAVCLACGLSFPLAQMFLFGKTDYRRPADAAVVLGARVYSDGRLSVALADRVRTACQLYRDGLVRTLIFSGGPGDGAVHETEGMRRMAVSLGVRAEDILVDEAGLNTLATVRNSKPMLARLQTSRVLVVSHFYHLPRIKLAYQRQGIEVFTVPARESYMLRQLPYNMAREVAALWVYYLRPLAG
jgi:vancomycin permeability regulator SanA